MWEATPGVIPYLRREFGPRIARFNKVRKAQDPLDMFVNSTFEEFIRDWVDDQLSTVLSKFWDFVVLIFFFWSHCIKVMYLNRTDKSPGIKQVSIAFDPL